MKGTAVLKDTTIEGLRDLRLDAMAQAVVEQREQRRSGTGCRRASAASSRTATRAARPDWLGDPEPLLQHRYVVGPADRGAGEEGGLPLPCRVLGPSKTYKQIGQSEGLPKLPLDRVKG